MRYREFCYFDSVLILAFLSTLGITRANDVSNQDNSTEYEFCTSQICNETGNEIIRNMDESVEACDDFYKHACGRWTDNHPIQTTKLTWDHHGVLRKNIQERLEEILNENGGPNSTIHDKIRYYFRSCTDLAAIEAQGLAPLESILSANGGWPLLLPPDNWSLKDNNLTLQKIIENYGLVTGEYPIKFMGYQLKNYTMNQLILNSFFKLPTIQHPTERDSLNTTYSIYMKAVATELASSGGSNVSSANIDKDVEDILKFETSLHELYLKNHFEKLTITEMQNHWDTTVLGHPEYEIDWLKFINNPREGAIQEVNATSPVLIDRICGFRDLGDLLVKTPLRTVVNYVHWTGINDLVRHTNKKMRDITSDWYSKINRRDIYNDGRSRFCLEHHGIRDGLAYAYKEKYATSDALDKVSEIVEHLRNEMKRGFRQSTWMDLEDKNRSQLKVDNMLFEIGYPETYNNFTTFEELHNQLVIGDNYFDNVVNTNRWKTKSSLNKPQESLREFIDWRIQPLDVDAVYMLTENNIMIPIALFQRGIFDPEIPMVMNYGALGSFIGHEIAHAFTPIGINIGESGIIEREWWSNSTTDEYKKTVKCFVEQYSNYTLTDIYTNETIKINGERTLIENFADNVGFQTSLKAYLSHNLTSIRIAVLKHCTDLQLYFYALANAWCGSPQTNTRFKNDVHSPHSVRINGALSNMPEFSKAFNCKAKDPMNPEKKCVF